jgi:hypothetical protein
MELSRQSYNDVKSMPVKKLYDYMKWKIKLEEDKQKMIKESMTENAMKQKRKKK